MARKRTKIGVGPELMADLKQRLRAATDLRDKERLQVALWATGGQHTLAELAQLAGRARSTIQIWPNRDPLANGETLIGVRLPVRSPRRFARLPWEMVQGPNVYTYAFNNPICYVDVNGLWTFGIGVTVGINFGPFNGTFSVGLVGDTQGNLNWWVTGGGGTTGAGAGVSGGVSVQVSNAKCNNDLVSCITHNFG